ncbi:hypothetical protein JCM19232_5860 [Vibrio ishigakensis]|uniref:Uncharacterized protein n=1 Tax=Vibrio ishigakensis TaxID=1481914 RepID=A0A0B8PFE8_9VIBR|nr:hypothetical protein JCM19232_5860 [Vibrio ishigakensis]
MLEPVEEDVSLPPSPVEEVIHESTPEPEAPKQTVKIESKPVEVVEVKEREVPERNQYQDGAYIIQLVALRNAENAATMLKIFAVVVFKPTLKKIRTSLE